MEVNSIYEGDNLKIMNKFPEKSIDLIYADPPFFSNKNYEVIWNDGAELRAFEDRWKGGIEHYISWMEPRLRECHRLLKDTGSMYLHCDWHADAHLRILMDRIFEARNFINEIIWQRVSAHNDSKRANSYGAIHDTILFYTKTSEYTYNTQFTDYRQTYIDSSYNKADEKGKFKTSDLTANNPGFSYTWKGQEPTSGRYWAYNKLGMEKLEEEGRIYYSKNGKPYLKNYLSEMKGIMLQDIWTDISPLYGGNKEKLGYPTQKPVALLERVIKTSSNKGDIVLDPFCGCGTTLIAAQKLSRKWVGIDVSPTACKLMRKRMQKEFGLNAMLVRGDVDLNYVKKLAPFEFQNWVITDKFMGKVSDRKSGDMGIDGFTPQVLGGYPIQVKHSEGIGRNVVDNFGWAIRRTKKTKGYIVAYSFGKGAYEEAARAKNEEGLEIILRTVQELLEGKIE